MLGSSYGIEAHIFRNQSVRTAVRSRVGKRARPQPVLIDCLNVHQFWLNARHSGFGEHPVLPPRMGVCTVPVSKRKQIIGIEMIGMMAIGPCWHGKPHVKHAETSTGDDRDDTVKHLITIQIGVETVVDKLTQQATALRDPIGNRISDLRQIEILQQVRLLITANRRDSIPNCRHSCPGKNRVLCFVNQLIQVARFKTPVERKRHVNLTGIFAL